MERKHVFSFGMIICIIIFYENVIAKETHDFVAFAASSQKKIAIADTNVTAYLLLQNVM